MVHNDGIAEKYNETLDKKTKKTDKEKRLLKSIRRAQGIEVNDYNTVIMRNDFLPYVISEFERYIKAIEEIVIDYENKNIKRTTWYGSKTLNVTVKDQKSNTRSSIVKTRRSWGALYDEEIELQVSQDEYDNQIFKN